MSKKQTEQFNRMRATLRRIAKDYQRAEQILRGGGEFGLDATETLEAAYDNIQSEAAAAVRNVRAIKADCYVCGKPMRPHLGQFRKQ